MKNLELKELVSKYSNQEELLLAIDQLLTDKIQEHQRLKVIIDLIPNTISWVNRDMTYFGVNQALAKTCGMDQRDFFGKAIGFHTHETFFYDFVTELFKSSSNTIYRELEVHIDNVSHTYLVSGTKLEDKDKAVIIGVDISELNQLKGHISFTEKLTTLGEMFAGIIHDINNPLMMIDGNIKRIKKRTQDEEILNLSSKVEMGIKKISKIVQGIKVYIRQDGEEAFQLEDLGQILEDARIICENKLLAKKVSLTIDPALNGVMIKCHFTQLFQVFVNLISNSIDAISNYDEKWIEIKYIIEDQNVEFINIEMIDSGFGIKKELQDKIFNAFFTTKGRGVGSGLGLSLCKKIISAHGGHLSLVDDRPHTTFLISLKK